MESMNKFKILTIVVICMFLFVVAAIYSNTKDVTQGKLESKNQPIQEQGNNNVKSEDDTDAGNLMTEIQVLHKRIDELNERVAGQEEASQGLSSLKCNIYGSMTPNGIEQLSPEAAVQEAKANNNEIVITCSF